jgi:hypothetical protein
MTTITWQIDYMNVSSQPIDGKSEVVLIAGWRCIGINGDFNASNYGQSAFPQPTTGSQFTPYADLTQDQVLGWCYANGVDQAEVEASVTQEVDNLANPPVVSPPLPWANQAA